MLRIHQASMRDLVLVQPVPSVLVLQLAEMRYTILFWLILVRHPVLTVQKQMYPFRQKAKKMLMLWGLLLVEVQLHFPVVLFIPVLAKRLMMLRITTLMMRRRRLLPVLNLKVMKWLIMLMKK